MDCFVFLSEKKKLLFSENFTICVARRHGESNKWKGSYICATAKYAGVGVGPYTCHGWLVKNSQNQRHAANVVSWIRLKVNPRKVFRYLRGGNHADRIFGEYDKGRVS